jgi:CheY-like chemotaxis protein
VVSGKVSLERRVLDLGDAVHRTLSTLKDAGRTQLHEVNVHTEAVWVDADPTRLEQMINNLVINAVKYTPRGGTIDVSARTQEGCAVFEVRDTGQGIDEALMPRIFDLFTQGERPLDRAQGGLGIGLTLVQRLARLHGGTIEAASDGRDKGSVFTLTLPMHAAPATKTPPEGAPAVDKRRVLLVEDNDDSRDMLKTLLELDGHDVVTAATGPDGVEMALTGEPEVAFIDIGLPGCDGFEVARRIRSGQTQRRTWLVALSGYGSAEDKQKTNAAGFDLHLVKPVQKDAIAKALATAGVGPSAMG